MLLNLPWVNVFDSKSTWNHVANYHIHGYCSKNILNASGEAVNDSGASIDDDKSITDSENIVRFTASNTWSSCLNSMQVEYVYPYDELDDYFECFKIDSDQVSLVSDEHQSSSLVVQLEFADESVPLRPLKVNQQNVSHSFDDAKRFNNDLPTSWKSRVAVVAWFCGSACLATIVICIGSRTLSEMTRKEQAKLREQFLGD